MTTNKTLKTKTKHSPNKIKTDKQRAKTNAKQRKSTILNNNSLPKITKEQYIKTVPEDIGTKRDQIEKMYINGMTAADIQLAMDVTRVYINNVISSLKKQAHDKTVANYRSRISTDLQLIIVSHADRNTTHYKQLIHVERLLDSKSIDSDVAYKLKQPIFNSMIKNDASYIDALTKVGVGALSTPIDNKEPIHSDIIVSSQSLAGLGVVELMKEAEDSIVRLKKYMKDSKVEVSTVIDTESEDVK